MSAYANNQAARRERIATAVLQGMLAYNDNRYDAETLLAQRAVVQADALMLAIDRRLQADIIADALAHPRQHLSPKDDWRPA